ncbi:MAG: transposase [Candidatus Omnitrophica bacterium]|nr:transposase [Candidatus Omnitrophota bacterium]
MARPLRIEYPNAFYHIIQRGIERRGIFISDKDRIRLLEYIDSCRKAYHAIIHTYCLMRNHYHLIIETPDANLSKVMHYLNTSYAVYFNTKYKRSGPLYQGRFKAILVDKDEYLGRLSRYIHLNPVRARLAKDPIEYQWSSYKYFVLSSAVPVWLDIDTILSVFDRDRLKARRQYKDFILDGIGEKDEHIERNTRSGFILGGEEFLSFVRKNFIEKREDDSEIPQLRKMRKVTTLEDISKLIVGMSLPDKRLKRRLTLFAMRKYTPFSLKEIAVFCGNIGDTGVSQAYKRVESERRRSKSLDSIIDRIDKLIKVKSGDLTP